jgi:hypothetical protein
MEMGIPLFDVANMGTDPNTKVPGGPSWPQSTESFGASSARLVTGEITPAGSKPGVPKKIASAVTAKTLHFMGAVFLVYPMHDESP